QTKRNTTKNASGYNLSDVKHKDGSLDLTPLLVGSQGTLAIITEAVVETEPYIPSTSLIIASFESVEDAANAVVDIKKLPSMPSALEMVDENLLNFIDKTNPNHLKGVLEKPFKKVMLFIEFDDTNA